MTTDEFTSFVQCPDQPWRLALTLPLIHYLRWLEVSSLGMKDTATFLLLRVILGIFYFLRNYPLFALWLIPSLKLQLCFPHLTLHSHFLCSFKIQSIF